MNQSWVNQSYLHCGEYMNIVNVFGKSHLDWVGQCANEKINILGEKSSLRCIDLVDEEVQVSPLPSNRKLCPEASILVSKSVIANKIESRTSALRLSSTNANVFDLDKDFFY